MSKELLKSILGGLYTEQIGEALGTRELAVVNDGSYIPRAKFNEEIKALKDQITARDKQLKDLEPKAAGNEELRKELQRLQDENRQASENYEAKVKQLHFDHTLEQTLIGLKARNTKAVKAMLNLENIKLDGDKFIGLDEQIKTLQQSDAYLFGEVVKPHIGGPSNPPAGGGASGENSNAEMNAFIRGGLGR